MTAETSNARGEVGRFRKRPVVIEAVQWHKPGDHPEVKRFLDTAEGVMGWTKHLADAWGQKFASEFYGIETLEGTMRVSVGDWIIRGVQGEFYPCKPEIFAATYEPADAAPPPAAARGDVQAGEVSAPDAEVWLFKGTDGAWRAFHSEQHRLDTIADGKWDVRKFTALTQQPEPKAEARGGVDVEAVEKVIGEMTDYLDQEVDPELDTIEKWRNALTEARNVR